MYHTPTNRMMQGRKLRVEAPALEGARRAHAIAKTSPPRSLHQCGAHDTQGTAAAQRTDANTAAVVTKCDNTQPKAKSNSKNRKYTYFNTNIILLP